MSCVGAISIGTIAEGADAACEWRSVSAIERVTLEIASSVHGVISHLGMRLPTEEEIERY